MDKTILNSVLEYIAAYQDENNQLSPTVREIAQGCFISKGGAARYLDILEAQGKITRKERKARTIRLTEYTHKKSLKNRTSF